MPRLALLALLVSFGAGAQEDPVHQIARAYLDALVGVGDDAARETLLGGVTMNASIASIGSWRIIAEDPVRKETGALQTASQLMSELDKAGRATLANLLNQSGATSSNDVSRSPVTPTAIAIRALRSYGLPQRRADFQLRIARAAKWLATFAPRTGEERVMRVLGLSWADTEAKALARAADELAAIDKATRRSSA